MTGWCFSNPVLLSSNGKQKVLLRGRKQRTNEDGINRYQTQKHRNGHEDIPERQSFFGALAVQASCPKESPDNLPIELEAIGSDQRDVVSIGPGAKLSK